METSTAATAGNSNDAIKPYNIGKYAVHGATKTWKVENTHNEYVDIFKGHTISGPSDWAYGHQRLTDPGRSSIKVKMQVPVEMIKINTPNCKFILNCHYFAPWKMPDC